MPELVIKPAHASDHRDAVLEDVGKYYTVPADASVRDFLSEHQTIAPLLIEAAPRLKSRFGDNAVFELRVPIDEAGSRTLYAVAMWPGKVQDARDALSGFDDDWWMARAGQAAGYIAFTYELV